MLPSDVLAKYWGYTGFRECQEEIISGVLAGNDLIGLLPTGGGKSLTFQIPALILPGLTLVVTPLISLMKDQVDNLRERNIKAACLHSGMTHAEQRLVFDRLDLGIIKLLYVSPERLGVDDFLRRAARWDINLIVVDEAHCISQWGYDFRPSYLNISSLRPLLPEAPILALTASATPQVVEDIADKLQMRHPAVVSGNFARNNLSYIVRHTDNKDHELLNILKHTTGSAIVYVRSRKRTASLSALLNENGISADFYHAGLEPHDKSEKQDKWKEGSVRVMVATNAFGMGIDKPDVRVVVHYDLPPSLEEYYQETGRAGRDGKDSFVVALASKADKGLLKRRLNESFPDREFILKVYEQAGNFLNVAVGEGYNKVYEFNLAKFLTIFELPAVSTLSALGILTRSGMVEFNENLNSKSRVHILQDRHELYSLSLDAFTDSVLQQLLRNCTGIFADYVTIDETAIAYKLRNTPQRVYEALLLLSRMKVIGYIPKSAHPYLFYPTSRELPKHVVIPRSVYEDRLEVAKRRTDAMINYIFENEECRVRRMLEYFGQPVKEDCGKCDVCRKRKSRQHAHDREQIIRFDLKRLIDEEGSLTPELIKDRFGTAASKAIDLVREMIEQGILCRDRSGKIIPANKCR